MSASALSTPSRILEDRRRAEAELKAREKG
jgi:hypothetical protein